MQLVYAALHRHAPITQFPWEEQLSPQEPQSLGSVLKSTHCPEQSAYPLGQEQLPPLQVMPPVHANPQTPQLNRSVWVSVQTPLHRVCPMLQAHDPPEHCFPGGQTFPQLPQFPLSV